MPYVDNHGLRIHYQVEGKGPPLVLLHGSTSNIQAWYQLGYVDLLKAHYQLIMIDSRGHGESDKPHDAASYALQLRVSDVVGVLDTLGIQQAHYWGYSMGAWIGFGLAQYATDRLQTLILGGSHPYAVSAEPFHGVDGKDTEEFIAAFEKFVGASITSLIRQEILANDLQALAAAMHDRDSVEAILPTMTMPCLLYAGTGDPRFQKVKTCVGDMPNAIFVALTGLNHAQAYMRSDLIVPHVEKFLQNVIAR